MTTRLTVAAAALLLSACAAKAPLPPSAPAISWEQRQTHLSPLRDWTLQGKIAIRVDQQNNAANLSWVQHGDSYRIFMAGPFGRGAVDIEGNSDHLRLVIAGEEPYETQTPQLLLHDRLGWSFPLHQVSWWIRGLPAPGTPHRKTLDVQQRLQTLEQSGWKIRYRDYRLFGANELPSKLTMTHGENLKLTLVFKSWELPQPSDQGDDQRTTISTAAGLTTPLP